MSKDKAEPMDTGAREVLIGTPSVNAQRVCYAARTLVAEVTHLFPETSVEYSNYNGRNTALDVTFDLTGLDDAGRTDLITLLAMVEDTDLRVAEVLVEGGSALASFTNNPRTSDLRDPFNLGDALDVLAGAAS
jgi:hypothetical protein